MSHWENSGKSDEWYTPKYIFDALDCRFEMDVAAPLNRIFVATPTGRFIHRDSLESSWDGFVWLNPPFGGRNGIIPWLDKLISHKNGIALTPDRTSTEWWQSTAMAADAVMFVKGKIKFIDATGKIGKQPSNGTTLFAFGSKGIQALENAEINGLGILMLKS